MISILISILNIKCIYSFHVDNLNSDLSGFYTFKSLRTHQRFNVPPKNSKIESDINRMLLDPLNTSPWAYKTPWTKSFTKEQCVNYGFLKNDWGYLDHTEDAAQPSGLIEGGPENYKGKGLKLKDGIDRPRTIRRPYTEDHGPQWRQRRLPGSISFTITPDANQDHCLYETEIDLERRQWGSWNRPDTSFFMPSAWRSKIKWDNPTDAIYPWIVYHTFLERMPPFSHKPIFFMPEPDPDLVLAAHNLFDGYMDIPVGDTTEECMLRQNRLLKEWDRLDELYSKNKDDNVLVNIETIKKLLFNFPEMDDSDSHYMRVLTEVAMIRAREILNHQAANRSNNPEFIENILGRIGGLCSKDFNGEWNYKGPERTLIINLLNYEPISHTFKLFTSVEEMAECYHKHVIEIRKEGRIHTLYDINYDNMFKEYALRIETKKFPSLYANYKPIWIHRKFGPEFGDALRKSQIIPEDELTNFDKPLRKRKKRFTNNEKKMNFVDDYTFYNKEYNY